MAKVVVIYAGGFQPFHTGHLSSYLQAKKAFPNADFYVAASADTKRRPIPYEEKKFLATQAGVNPEDFPNVIVKSPLNPKEILGNYNPEEDIFVLVRSERDPMSYTKKDGTPGYFQPYVSGKQLKPFKDNGYVFVTKKHDFNINGQEVYSGSQVRDLYSKGNDQDRINIVKQLYPRSKRQKTIKGILDKYLGEITMEESIINFISKVKPLLKEANEDQKLKIYNMLMEARKHLKTDEKSLTENKDYLPEK